MLGRIIKRSASSKAFSLPPVKFRYATRDLPSTAEEESRAEGKEKHTSRISSPVRPTQRNTKKNHSGKNKFQEKILNQITQKHDSIKSELGLENHKVHAASHSIKFDPKSTYQQYNTYQPIGELIYGIYPVQLALEAQRRTFHRLMYKKGCELRNERIRDMVDTAASRGIHTTGLTPSQFRRVLTGDQTHQGICCDVSHLPFLVFQEHEYLTVKEYDEVAGDRQGTEGGEMREGAEMWDRRELRENKEVRENRVLKESRERKMDGRNEGNQYNSSEGSLDEENSLNIDQDSLSGKAKDKHKHKNFNTFTTASLHKTSSYYQEEVTENRTDIISFPSNLEESVQESSETEIPQLWIYLDQIQDPMNFGAVLRSAYFFGVDKILTSEHKRLVT